MTGHLSNVQLIGNHFIGNRTGIVSLQGSSVRFNGDVLEGKVANTFGPLANGASTAVAVTVARRTAG